ncbi:efflux RND transporter periplasmic adaptor subunit [Frateuria aurantia]
MRLRHTTINVLAVTGRVVLSLILAVVAWYLLNAIWTYYERDPRTRDGHVRADVVGVTTDVSGLVTEVNIEGNRFVHKGQILFQVDPARFAIALRQADATVEARQADLTYARQQAVRNRALRGLVSQQATDQSDSNLRAARAALDLAIAARDSAALDLRRATVRAPVDGVASYVALRPGTYVHAGTAVLALVDAASIRVEGYFQETRLSRIHIGDRARIHLIGEKAVLYGHVSSITGAVNDSDTTVGGNLLPSIDPNFSWVRLAQRVPVRISIDGHPSQPLLLPGRTASIVILGPDPGDARSRPAQPGSAPEVARPVTGPVGARSAAAPVRDLNHWPQQVAPPQPGAAGDWP